GQLATARDRLGSMSWLDGRYALHRSDAADLPFEARSFDGAFLCWVLEHVPSPSRVLSEVRRVLAPGASVYVTEVMNSSFLLDPYSPNVWRYWMAFNDFQVETGGDPFVGAKLGNLLLAGGYREVTTQVKTFHFDNREPARRKTMIAFWEELLLSAAEQLVAADKVDEETVEGVRREMRQVQNDPDAVFFYSFVQARATVI
ncbi:MAG: methyltransferase domain-containing protein, partial [Lysobacter sp.]|nr:methyltransferase domain-containing protein [Lysobacter sp.]